MVGEGGVRSKREKFHVFFKGFPYIFFTPTGAKGDRTQDVCLSVYPCIFRFKGYKCLRERTCGFLSIQDCSRESSDDSLQKKLKRELQIIYQTIISNFCNKSKAKFCNWKLHSVTGDSRVKVETHKNDPSLDDNQCEQWKIFPHKDQ